MEAKAIKCVMLGYQKGVKGYRLWCTESGKNKVIISRDGVFKEDEMPYLEKKSDDFQIEVETPDPGATEYESTGDQTQAQEDVEI